MREAGLFLLAIVVTLAVLATIDPGASSPRQPPSATGVPAPRS
jgi:hypothetical protein